MWFLSLLSHVDLHSSLCLTVATSDRGTSRAFPALSRAPHTATAPHAPPLPGWAELPWPWHPVPRLFCCRNATTARHQPPPCLNPAPSRLASHWPGHTNSCSGKPSPLGQRHRRTSKSSHYGRSQTKRAGTAGRWWCCETRTAATALPGSRRPRAPASRSSWPASPGDHSRRLRAQHLDASHPISLAHATQRPPTQALMPTATYI